jgi:putative transposase
LTGITGCRSNAAQLLGLSRSSVYYRFRPVRADRLALMRRIDELHLELPFAGSRMLSDLLALEGTRAGRHRLRGIEAPYRKKSSSAKHAYASLPTEKAA